MKHIITILTLFTWFISSAQYIDVTEAYKYEPDDLLQNTGMQGISAGNIIETPYIYIYIYIE